MFTFLNTIILSALALSLIPILIHLLNRKKSKLVFFSTLVFLKALQKKKMKRVKIQQILLLILRTLIILLAVMAFARPVSKMKNQGQIDAHAKTSVALIIDNSIGTSYISDKGMVLDDIKNKAEQILNYLNEGDEAVILSGANSSNIQNASFTQNFTELKALVKSLTSSYARSNINEALYLANKSFASAKNVNREIYVLTTLQASNFNDEKVILQDNVKLIFIDCSTKEFRNTGIRNAQVMTKIIEKNKPIEIRTTVKNYGRDRIQDVLLSVYLDGRRAGQSSLTINAEEESVINLKIIPSRTGLLQGWIEIDDDAFSADNKRYFHVYIPPQIKVMLAGNTEKDIEFIRLALNPGLESMAPIQARSVLFTQMAVENLNDYDVIVMSNIPRLDEALMRRIEAFLNSGKGLLMIPGSDTDITNHNILFSKIGFGKIFNLTTNQAETYTKFGKIDYYHPIIRGMFDLNVPNDTPLESPNFNKFFKLDPAAQSRTLISYTTNTPFLEESVLKGNAVLLVTSAVNLSWSDWPLKGIFVPLINRSVYYLYSKNFGTNKSYESGDLIELRLAAVSGQDISVTGPEGVELKPKVTQGGDDVVITVPYAEIPGTYKIFQQGKLFEMIDLNISTQQLEFKKLDKKNLDVILLSNQYELSAPNDNIENIILQSRFGVELWKWFVFGAAVLLIAEILVAQSHRFIKD